MRSTPLPPAASGSMSRCTERCAPGRRWVMDFLRRAVPGFALFMSASLCGADKTTDSRPPQRPPHVELPRDFGDGNILTLQEGRRVRIPEKRFGRVVLNGQGVARIVKAPLSGALHLEGLAPGEAWLLLQPIEGLRTVRVHVQVVPKRGAKSRATRKRTDPPEDEVCSGRSAHRRTECLRRGFVLPGWD